jgi:1-acyl-sn-glycerol-3-phosphate acyltransferase
MKLQSHLTLQDAPRRRVQPMNSGRDRHRVGAPALRRHGSAASMLNFLPAPLIGIIASLLLALNALFWVPILLCFAIVRLILPVKKVRLLIDPILITIAETWISGNSGWMKLTQRTEWDVEGIAGLDPQNWYLVNSNHQTWADIFVLQHLFNRRIPLLKFFIKDQLKWVPVMGLAWWALDFPFMRRHSEEYLKLHPEMRGKDQAATRKACEKFALIPTSVMNFLEGTRFTPAKHQRQAIALPPPAQAQGRRHRAGTECHGRPLPGHPRRHHRVSGRGAQLLGIPLRPAAAGDRARPDPPGAGAPDEERLRQ